jgi:hypothetical protein
VKTKLGHLNYDFATCQEAMKAELEDMVATPNSSVHVCSLTFQECAYVLRFVELNDRNPESPWSIRQTAVYQKYLAANQSSTWLLVAVSVRLEERLNSFIQRAGSLAALNPFEIHLLLLDTAIANWRPYMVYLYAETNKQVRTAGFG